MDAAFRKGVLWSGIITAAMLVLSAYAWVKIPAGQAIATHWGINGQPDGYSSKPVALLMLPLTNVFLTGLFLLIARIEPRREHLRMSAGAYAVIWVSVLGLMAVLHGFTVAVALGVPVHLSTVLPVVIGALFAVIGAVLRKIHSNYMAGIRTPWTLSSELAWEKTHLFGGRIFLLLGVLIALTAPLQDPVLFVGLLVGESLLVSVMLSVYSYVAWKADPERKNDGATAHPGSLAALRPLAILTVALMIVMAVAAVIIRS